MMDFTNRLHQYAAQINARLAFHMQMQPALYQNGADAMRYSLLAGGKRIRGALILEFCRMLGGDTRMALEFACAMEMVHCGSLIQDDLPCMDNDDFRRGRPACHKQYGEATALLAGDALFIRAFEVLADSGADGMQLTRAVKTLAHGAGMEGMIGGQVVDLESEGRSVDYSHLQTLHRLKTGALIRASCQLGAIAARATEAEEQACIAYGEALGLAFQITDDILDVTGDEAALGKPVGSDASQHKTTYVTLFGLEQARRLAEEASIRAKTALADFPDNGFLLFLTDMLLQRQN